MKASNHPKSILLLFAIVAFVYSGKIDGQVLINEISSNNESGLQDFQGEFSDWIEIYNAGTEAVDLTGYSLVDEVEFWQLPDNTILDSFSFLLVFASNKDTILNELHANFAINAGGEKIQLLNVQGDVIDETPFDNLMPNQSLARVSDGAEEWKITEDASPLFSNDQSISVGSSGLSLNEILSDNSNGADWIEIYNSTSGTAQLTGYYLSDDPNDLLKWQFPNIPVSALSAVKIVASGLDMEIEGEWHTNFSVSKEGETIYFSGPFGDVLDFIRVPALDRNYSYGKGKEEKVGWVSFCSPSPGEVNTNGAQPIPVEFSFDSGHYLEEIELDITTEEGYEIRYTVNGEKPTVNSALFENPILLGTREGEPDELSIIQCTTEPYEPLAESKKANVIRAAAFRDGDAVSKIVTKTYLIDENPERYTTPIISLVGDPDNFFDEDDGIFVNYSGRGPQWEREISIEYMENGQLVLSQDCGIRIHGGGSRHRRQKSLKLYARHEYGQSHFQHSFFDSKEIDRLKRIVLRSPRGFNDSLYSDELSVALADDLKLVRQADDQVVVFLNGEYWGFYHLREKIDAYFISENFGVDSDSVSIARNDPYSSNGCEYGDCSSYLNLLELIANSPELDDSLYSYIENQLDIDSFIDYLCFNFYCHNNDWPYNNVRVWRAGSADKWKFIPFDLDFSMYNPYHEHINDFFENLNDTLWPYQPASKLYDYEPFRTQFLKQFEHLLQNDFSEETVLEKIADFEERVSPEFEEHRVRFALLETEADRNDAIDSLRQFAALRPCAVEEDLENVFSYAFDSSICEPSSPDTTTALETTQEEFDFTVQMIDGHLKITWNDYLKKSVIDLFDLSGRLIWREETHSVESFFEIPIAPIANGIYILRLSDGKRIYTKKIHISQ